MRKLKNEELTRLTVESFKNATKKPIIVVLDNIRSLNNIGSIFRTADAFLIQKIYLCGITAQPPHRDIQKTALGSTASVDWAYVEDTSKLLQDLKAQNVITIAVEQAQGACELQNFTPQKNQVYAFIFGNEVKGVAQEVVTACDKVVEIPQFGTKHSLNVAISCGVVLWDMHHKLN